jgi:hypothetical protein
VSLWPSVRASLNGGLKIQAEVLWNRVYESYSAVMDGSGTTEALITAVTDVYNSDLLEKVITNQS